MNLKVFPCAADKKPLVKGWQEVATSDPEQLRLWGELFKGRIAFWGVPTGPINGLLVLDVDVKKENGFATLAHHHVPATMRQKTMSGGAHYFFKYPGDGRVYGNRASFLPGLDVRGAGGYVIWYGTVENYPLAEPPDWLLADSVRSLGANTLGGTPVRLDPTIAEGIFRESLRVLSQAAEGERNATLNLEAFKIGQLVASGSLSREYAYERLHNSALGLGMPAREAHATIASGIDGGFKKPLTSPFGTEEPKVHIAIPPAPGLPERWTPLKLTRQDLLNTSKLRKPQLFQDWSTEDISITTADGGTGKTTFKLFEAICLALGERFIGFDCKQRGKTLFITGEDTDKKLAALLGAIMRQMGLFEERPGNDEKIQCILDSIIIKKDSDLCLITKDRQGFLHPDSNALMKVLQAVEDHQPKMIVLDPISSFWGSEAALNDMNKAVIKFVSELVDKSHACVEMINHMGKQSSANKDMSQFAGRGGTGLPSNARVSRVFRTVLDDEYLDLTGEQLTDKQSAFLCNVNKFSDGSPLTNKPFIVLREGYLFSRKVLSPKKQQEAEDNLTADERIIAFVREERESERYPTAAIIVGHFISAGNPMKKVDVERALQRLQYKGYMGERLKATDNIDAAIKAPMFVITDMDGKEI